MDDDAYYTWCILGQAWRKTNNKERQSLDYRSHRSFLPR